MDFLTKIHFFLDKLKISVNETLTFVEYFELTARQNEIISYSRVFFCFFKQAKQISKLILCNSIERGKWKQIFNPFDFPRISTC